MAQTRITSGCRSLVNIRQQQAALTQAADVLNASDEIRHLNEPFLIKHRGKEQSYCIDNFAIFIIFKFLWSVCDSTLIRKPAFLIWNARSILLLYSCFSSHCLRIKWLLYVQTLHIYGLTICHLFALDARQRAPWQFCPPMCPPLRLSHSCALLKRTNAVSSSFHSALNRHTCFFHVKYKNKFLRSVSRHKKPLKPTNNATTAANYFRQRLAD